MLRVVRSVLPVVLLVILNCFLHRGGFVSSNLGGGLTFLMVGVTLPSSVFISMVGALSLSRLNGLAKPLVSKTIVLTILCLVDFILMGIYHIPRNHQNDFVGNVIGAGDLFVNVPLGTTLFNSRSVACFLIFCMLDLLSV